MMNGTRDVFFTPSFGAHSRGGASWHKLFDIVAVSVGNQKLFCGRCKLHFLP
jgi:hypothetical protein